MKHNYIVDISSPYSHPKGEELFSRNVPEGSEKLSVVEGSMSQMPNNARELREERLMSKAELARRAGLSPITIDRIEKGYPCRLDTKRKIILALGLDLKDRRMVFPD
jgi:DNA-binding XRE family transcriptional regulator